MPTMAIEEDSSFLGSGVGVVPLTVVPLTVVPLTDAVPLTGVVPLTMGSVGGCISTSWYNSVQLSMDGLSRRV